MRGYIELLEVMMLNLSLGTTFYIQSGAKKKELKVLIILTILTLLFSYLFLYFWNLTLLLSELTIIEEMQYVYGKIFPIILPFLF